MKDNQDNHVGEVIEALCAGKIDINEAVGNLLKDAGVKTGAKVAVIADPTYPFDGQKGVVRQAYETGHADVEFPNGTKAKLQSSLLIPV